MKICQFNQPVGIGDIFFTQKIAAHYVDKNYRVIWPVRKDLLWMNDYLISPGVLYVDIGSQITLNDEPIDPLIIDIRSADEIHPDAGFLECKYKLVGLDYKDWKYYFNFKRNINKENCLFYDILGLKDDEPYAFVNRFVGTAPEGSAVPGSNSTDKVKVTNNNIKVVDLRWVADYNVLDWCKVLENASEIYMVDTVFNYILEKLNVQATTKHLYSRFTPSNFCHIKNLWSIDWEYMDA